MAYLRNTWYVAAWDSEVKIQSLLSRRLLDEQSMDTNDLWALKPVLLGGDASAVRARRVLEKMIREEMSQRSNVA